MTYTYDIAGIKQSQSIDGILTNYLVDPNHRHDQVLEELDSTNMPQVIYTYGDDLISQTENRVNTHIWL